MSESQINLSPPFVPQPRRAPIPFSRARRWITTYEADKTPSVKVFITPRAFIRCCAHAGSDLDNEVGGWLVGRWRADDQSGAQFIIIETVIPAQHTRYGSTFLTFTQESQLWLYNHLQESYPNKELVGWYHTHPRMSVFLSQYDTWLHNNFFTKPYQVALVIEPHSKTGGFFIRTENGELDTHHYFGFYELNDGRKRSVVHWQNVYLETEVINE